MYMALINCPECGNEITRIVNACPSCGYPIKLSFLDKISLKVKNNTRKQNLLLASYCGIFLLLCVIVANALILHSRVTFADESEMQQYIQGTWQEVGDATKIVFRGEQASTYWKYEGLEMTSDVTYYPRKGYIEYISTRYYLKKAKNDTVRLVASDESYGRLSDSTSVPYQEPRT